MRLRSCLTFLLLLPVVALAQTPARTFEPTVRGSSRFGNAMASVPDVDGDGVDDLVVGARNEDDARHPQRGRVHVFSGASGDTLYRLLPPTEHAFAFGYAVAGLPDVDGDGRGDVLVGVPDERDPAVSNRDGRAYLFSGATGTLLRPLLPTGSEFNGDFGYAVTSFPDRDGDGRPDLAVAARYETSSSTEHAGAVYVLSSATGAALALIRSGARDSQNRAQYFGESIARVPDVSGDGVDDLLVGAPNWRGGATTAESGYGRAYLFSGASDALLQTLDTPNGEFEGAFGRDVAAVPDVDGDGRADLLVGAPTEDVDTRENAGRAYLFSGANGALLRTFTSPTPFRFGGFGSRVAGIADLDGDGRGEAVVAGPNEGLNVTSDAGRVHVLSGVSGTPLALLRGPRPSSPLQVSNFGLGVAALPDLNGDGRADLLVGAPEQPNAAGGRGVAFLFHTAGVATGTEEETSLSPLAITVSPLPSTGAVMIRFTLDRPGPARLVLYDVQGRAVAVVADGVRAAGAHAVSFDASSLPAALYRVRVTTAHAVAFTSLVVIR